MPCCTCTCMYTESIRIASTYLISFHVHQYKSSFSPDLDSVLWPLVRHVTLTLHRTGPTLLLIEECHAKPVLEQYQVYCFVSPETMAL